MKNKKNFYKISARIILLIVLALFLYSIINYKILEGKISESVQNYGSLTIFAFSFILDFLPQYISPHVFVFSSKFLDLSFLYVTFLVLLGSFLGSFIGFCLGSKLGESKMLIDFIGKEKSSLFRRKINEGGRYFVLLASISPLPYIPLFLGMLRMNFKNFILFGILPRMAGLIFVGLFTHNFF